MFKGEAAPRDVFFCFSAEKFCQQYFRILDMAQYTMLKKAHMIEDTCGVLESADRKMKDKAESIERLGGRLDIGTVPDCWSVLRSTKDVGLCSPEGDWNLRLKLVSSQQRRTHFKTTLPTWYTYWFICFYCELSTLFCMPMKHFVVLWWVNLYIFSFVCLWLSVSQCISGCGGGREAQTSTRWWGRDPALLPHPCPLPERNITQLQVLLHSRVPFWGNPVPSAFHSGGQQNLQWLLECTTTSPQELQCLLPGCQHS